MAIPEPKCVQWKRKGQRALQKKLAGMTRAEARAFWRESYKKMLSEQDESKRRMQETQAKHGPPEKPGTAAMPEPKCVQWKREWRRAAQEKSAGAARAEEST